MIVSKHPDFQQLKALLQRPVIGQENLEGIVGSILRTVKSEGDRALLELTGRFDGVRLERLFVTPEEFKNAEKQTPKDLKKAIRVAAANIRKFHQRQREQFRPFDVMPGVRCWRQNAPIGRVGLYIPGGTAPLFSTVLMLGIPAQVAGCEEVVLCTPPGKDGAVHPAILFAAQLSGIETVLKVGGAQAIAALAYGTESLQPVNKIFGPGNRYVTCAKMLVQKDGVAIDLPAGPSEVLVVADETSVPAFVAADLLSQAEHDPDSQAVLLTTSGRVLDAVLEEVKKQSITLPRYEIVQKALAHSVAVLLDNQALMLDAVNFYAPEHLILACENAEAMAARVRNAGSIFIGNFTPEVAGDYASGANHTLPTYGCAHSYSGVSLDSFIKKITVQHITPEGLQRLAPTLTTLAAAEGLAAHERAVRVRLEN